MTFNTIFVGLKVLLDKGRVSEDTKNIFECVASSAIIEFLAHESEFLSPSACLTKLHENKYFECDDEGKADWPPVLAQLTSFADLRTPQPDKEIALSALGGCLWYLINCKIDLQLINLRRFDLYKPELAATQGDRSVAAANKLTGNMVGHLLIFWYNMS
jgi:DNA mismatch repair protein MSH6